MGESAEENVRMAYSPAPMLNPATIRAISLDLDDTLWPIWPTIARAEAVLLAWLQTNAAQTAALYTSPEALRAIRNQLELDRPDLAHDLSALRRESIRLALKTAGDHEHLAEPAFEIFFAERMRVELYDDAQPALAFLAARYPLVAVSNGNADVQRVGLGNYFKASLSAREFGVPKPDARIFHAAAEATGFGPEQVLHVGDDALLDVVGATNAGMQAAWLNRSGQTWGHGLPPHVTVASLTELCVLLGASGR
jgi:HAD superfamily hydrolase (TIGR01549 family)